MGISIAQVMGKVCDAAASAANRYADISGEDPLTHMPEYFLSAMVANAVACKEVSATLEVNLGRLREWDNNGRARFGFPTSVSPTAVDELTLCDDQRPDLVLFTGDPCTAQIRARFPGDRGVQIR